MKPFLIALALAALALAAFWLWTPDRDRGTLEARYLASPAEMLQLGEWRLRLRDSGPRDAPAVILLHGFGASLETWDALADALLRQGRHRVIRFDLPGSGLSAPDPAGRYTDARGIELLLALMGRLRIERASIVGHSIGGRLAWTFAALHPERLDSLVLIAPDGFASPGFAYGRHAEVPALLRAMRFVLPKPLLRMNLAPAYADPAFLTDALATRYHELLLAPGARSAMLARMEQTVLVEPVPLLRQIRAPTLLVWGERDAMIPIANAADYASAIAGSKLAPIAAAGHLPHEEAATATAQAILAFLELGCQPLPATAGCGPGPERSP